MLPHEPEAVEAMRARFPAALDEVFTRDELLLGYQIQPGARRRHVFDFADGMRLIVSREDWGGGP